MRDERDLYRTLVKHFGKDRADALVGAMREKREKQSDFDIELEALGKTFTKRASAAKNPAEIADAFSQVATIVAVILQITGFRLERSVYDLLSDMTVLISSKLEAIEDDPGVQRWRQNRSKKSSR